MPNPETLFSPQTDPDNELLEQYPTKELVTRRAFNNALVKTGVGATLLVSSLYMDSIATIQSEMHSKPIEQLEHPPKVDCIVANTKFLLTPEQVKRVRLNEFGDSVAFGFFGAILPHPDAQFQTDGMNTFYNQIALSNDNLSLSFWDYVDAGVIGSEVNQWEQEIKWYEIDKTIKDNVASVEVVMENENQETESISETWEIGTTGNNLFHFAFRHRYLIEKLYSMDALHLDTKLIEQVAGELQNVYKETKQEYRQFLELIYSLKTSGAEPNLDRIVLIGLTDPTVLDAIPIEDTNGKSFVIEMDDVKRKYTHNAIVNMNNALKETINEFIASHPETRDTVLWVDPSEFLQREDMHDIHPSELGYWKMAREILDHYYVTDNEGNVVQLGPIALPKTDPNKPKPELHKKKKIERRAFLRLPQKIA